MPLNSQVSPSHTSHRSRTPLFLTLTRLSASPFHAAHSLCLPEYHTRRHAHDHALKHNSTNVFHNHQCCNPSHSTPNDYHIISSPDQGTIVFQAKPMWKLNKLASGYSWMEHTQKKKKKKKTLKNQVFWEEITFRFLGISSGSCRISQSSDSCARRRHIGTHHRQKDK